MGTAGAGDRGWRLLATLVGMRVTVALGSRLRGNDGRGAGMTGGEGAGTVGGGGVGTTGGEGAGTTGAGDRGWGLLATLVGMRVMVALGSRLRGNDGRGAGMTGAGAGARTTGGEGVGTVGGEGVRTVGAGDRGWGLLAILCRMRVMVALGSRLRGNDGRGAGTTRGRRGNDEGEARERREEGARKRWERATGVGVVGDLGWYASDGCAGFPPTRE